MNIDKQLLDDLTAQAQESPRLRMNYDLRDSAEDLSQRMLNALEPGTVLPIHRHRHTAETYVLLRGRIDVMFYDDSGAEVRRFELDPMQGAYGVHIPHGQWHTLEVLESAVIMEVKEGPYAPITAEDMLNITEIK